MESTIYQPNRLMLYMNGELGDFAGITDVASDLLTRQVFIYPYDTFTSGVDGEEYPFPATDYTSNGIGDNQPLSPWGRFAEDASPNNTCHAAVWDKEEGFWYIVDNDDARDMRLMRCTEMLDTDVQVIATNFIDDNTHIVKDILIVRVEAETGFRKVLVFRIAPREYTGAVSGEPYNTTLAWMPIEGGALTTFDTILYPRDISSSDVQRQLLWSMEVNRNTEPTLAFYGLIDCFFYTSDAQTHYQQRVAAWTWNPDLQTFNAGIKTGISGHFIGPRQVQTDLINFPLTVYTRLGFLPSANDFNGAICFVRQRFVEASTIDSSETGFRRTQHDLITPAGGSNTGSTTILRLPLGPHEIVDEDFNQVAPRIYGAQPWQDDEARGIYISMEGAAGSPPQEGVGIFFYPPNAQSTTESVATANRVQVSGRQAIAASNEPRAYPLKLVLGPGCY